MYLQSNIDDKKYEIIDLISYNDTSLVTKLNDNPSPMISSNDQMRLTIALYSDDNKLLRNFYCKNYSHIEAIECEDLSGFIFALTNKVSENETNETTQQAIETIRAEVLTTLTNELAEKINDGVFLPTSIGLKQFSFEEHDQRNISNIFTYLQNNTELQEYYYHANGELSMLYSRQDLEILYTTMLEHIANWTEKFRQIRNFIENCDDIETLMSINLLFNIPTEE